MFKHILIPTDGSPVSAKAVKAGIAAWPSRPVPRSPATTPLEPVLGAPVR